jgi:hypothetical protein
MDLYLIPYLIVFGNDAEERRQTQLMNHVIRDRMRQVCYAA